MSNILNEKRYSPLLWVQSLGKTEARVTSELRTSRDDLTYEKTVNSQLIGCDEVLFNTTDSENSPRRPDLSLEEAGIKITVGKTAKAVQIGSNNHMCIQITKPTSAQLQTGAKDQRRKVVQIKVPKRAINDDDIEKVAVHIGSDWRRLGVKLGLVRGELDAFEYDYRTAGLHEIIYQMLLAWKEKQGAESSIRYVAARLLEMKRPDVAKLFSL
ncbi:hypothetical protein LSH36_119g07028 [Paralvinella palmiformis]|uniref:Death domain-containing protein n=1 Tax=Paralvinella palmiformis TaxID=53620 RepID=A0AAD9JXM7_9ANNE|nr:hypothetical protein LSH36_119g07028 [Paralvinella palmiformis]